MAEHHLTDSVLVDEAILDHMQEVLPVPPALQLCHSLMGRSSVLLDKGESLPLNYNVRSIHENASVTGP